MFATFYESLYEFHDEKTDENTTQGICSEEVDMMEVKEHMASPGLCQHIAIAIPQGLGEALRAPPRHYLPRRPISHVAAQNVFTFIRLMEVHFPNRKRAREYLRAWATRGSSAIGLTPPVEVAQLWVFAATALGCICRKRLRRVDAELGADRRCGGLATSCSACPANSQVGARLARECFIWCGFLTQAPLL